VFIYKYVSSKFVKQRHINIPLIKGKTIKKTTIVGQGALNYQAKQCIRYATTMTRIDYYNKGKS